MKRCGLVVALLAGLLLTVWGLQMAGWFSRACAVSLPAPEVEVKPLDPLATPAGLIYRQCRPHHWRYCILQH
jgi:hypothetical protein